MRTTQVKNVLMPILLLASIALHAQEGIGLNPPSIKWYHIRTPAGRIIFPRGLDSIAFHTAALMEYLKLHDRSIAGMRDTKRIPTILQNQSTLPAGFSTPAPWRNEFYLTPPQNMFLGPVQWMDAMPIHEYRHTQQFSMANQGFTWVYKILMGQTGWLFNSLMTQPLWFREGDAVTNETIFTKGGRGRLPSFNMEYRAMRLSGYHFNYEKGHYLSFKDYVPNPYRIGYYMTTKGRRDFGEDIWTNVLNDTYQRKGFFWPFSRSLKKYTGMNTREFYRATVDELDSIWTATDKTIKETPSKDVVNRLPRKYTNYHFPQYAENGDIIVLKSGLDLINTYYRISEGQEKKMFSPGIYTDDHITTVVEGNLMTWAESGFHERWINVDYSIIKSCDLRTGKVSKLTSRTRYFSPAPSKDGSKIIVSETDMRNRYSLLILDAHTGKVLKRLPNPDNTFFTHMRWEDERYIVAVILDSSGNALARIDTETGGVEMLLGETDVPLSRPYPTDKYVFFSAGSDGINNIFALDRATKDILQVTAVRFGAFEPMVSKDNAKLLYSEYTAGGYRIREAALDHTQWKLTSLNNGGDIQFHVPLDTREGGDLAGVAVDSSYTVHRYHALTAGLLNFYGWTPLPNIPEYGVEVYTRNLMSTLIGTVGFAWNTNEDRARYYARLTYAALYPEIEINANKGMRHSANIQTASARSEFFEQDWRENSFSAGLRFPFRLTQGTHQTRLELAGLYEYYDISAVDSTDADVVLSQSSFNAFKAELDFSRLQIQARQHVKPRWGQQVNIDYEKAFEAEPERLHAEALLYFPGMFRTHSFNLRFGWKKEEVIDTYRFIDDFIMPRGYEPAPYNVTQVASANYELPLWYPDVAAGPVAFFQRLRANFFLDYGEGSTSDFVQPMTSAGGELLVDLRLFRLFQMTLNLRFNAPFDDPAGGTIPFQFLVTRFELAN